MRKLLLVLALLAMPLFAISTTTPASAAAPIGLTQIDRAGAGSLAERVYCRYHCRRVCTKRNYHGHCVYWTRKCVRRCYRPHYYHHRW